MMLSFLTPEHGRVNHVWLESSRFFVELQRPVSRRRNHIDMFNLFLLLYADDTVLFCTQPRFKLSVKS